MSNKNASTYGSITQDLSAGSPHKKAGPKGMSEMSYTEYSKKRFASTVTPAPEAPGPLRLQWAFVVFGPNNVIRPTGLVTLSPRAEPYEGEHQ
jgi:hypothetical protein